MVERYAYSPYGLRTVLDGSYGARGTSSYDFELGHQGGRWDGLRGLYHFRNRPTHPTLGRWMTRDPIGYQDGMNYYQYAGSVSTLLRDPLGLDAGWARCDPGGGAWGDEHSKVAVECSDVESAGVPVGKHCSVVGACKGKPTLRWEDAGARAQAGEGVEDRSGHPDNSENARKKERPDKDDYLDQDNGYPNRTGWRRYEVECNKESRPCEIYRCLKESIRTANFVPYKTLGPNSNTFVHALLNKCGCKLKTWQKRSHIEYVTPTGNIVSLPGPMMDMTEPDDAPGWNTQAPDYWPKK